MAVVPLAVAPGVFVAYDLTPKLLALGAASCLCLASIGEWYPGLAALAASVAGRVFLAGMLVQAISLTLSSVGSEAVGLSLAGTTWRRYGLATQLAVLLMGLACAGYFARNPARLRSGVRPLMAAGFCASLVGIAQYLGYDFLFDPGLYTFRYLHVVRPPSTLGHAMYFAAFLLPVACIGAALWGERNGTRLRWFWLAAAVSAVAAILFSGTRSAMLGLMVAGMIWAVRTRLKAGRREVLAAALAAALLTAGLAAAWYTGAGGNVRASLARWGADRWGGPRLMMWRESLGLLGRHALIGAGPETFAQEFRAAESAALGRAYPDFYLESPHNLLLETGLAQGGLGLAGLALVWGAVLWGGWKAAARGPLAAGLLCAVAAMLVALQFMPLTVADAVCLYGMGGMLVGLRCPDGSAAPVRMVWPRRAAAAAIPAFAAMALLLALQDLEFARAGGALRRGDLAAAARDYQKARTLAWIMPGQDLWLSRQFAAAAANTNGAPEALRLAMEASRRAERYSEEPFNAGYQTAALAIAGGDLPAGEAKLRAVVKMAPNWYKPRLLLAQTLLLEGRVEQAKAEAAAAVDLAGERRAETERAIQDLLNAVGRQNARGSD